MNENPVMIVLYLGVAGYVLNLYRADYRGDQSGRRSEGGLPGATAMNLGAVLIGILGALAILAIETGGEITLGIASEQSEMVWYFVFAKFNLRLKLHENKRFVIEFLLKNHEHEPC